MCPIKTLLKREKKKFCVSNMQQNKSAFLLLGLKINSREATRWQKNTFFPVSRLYVCILD